MTGRKITKEEYKLINDFATYVRFSRQLSKWHKNLLDNTIIELLSCIEEEKLTKELKKIGYIKKNGI